jgi:hypothetical protein
MSWRYYNMQSAVSPDGLTFRTVGTVATHAGGDLDSLNLTFYDPRTKKYTAFARWKFGEEIPRAEFLKRVPPLRRGISMITSDRWAGEWTGRREPLSDPKDLPGENGFTDVYSSSIQPYRGQYIGLPAMYFREPINDYTNTAGPIYPTVMHSRDAVHWSFPDHRHSVLDLEAHRQNRANFGMAFPAANLIEHDGALWIYYLYDHRQHHEPLQNPNPRRIHLAKLRLDGFGAIQSREGALGYWGTPPIRLPKNVESLRVNLKAPGDVRVSVFPEGSAAPLDGFTAADAVPLKGDHLNAEAAWRNAKLADLGGKIVQFRFELKDSAIYSFHLTSRGTGAEQPE